MPNSIQNLEDAVCKSMLKEAVDRLDDLRNAETKRVDEQLDLRAEYSVQLAVAEAKRIDAIRAVDVNAVSVANEKATAQAIVLANQVSQSAETLRALVAATAATTAQQLTQLTTQLTDRLTSLEKAQYESKGNSGGARDVWGWVFGGAVALIGFGLTIYFALHK